MYVLRRTVQVAPDGGPASGPLKTIERGTPIDAIPASELAQLAGGHFEGDGELPVDVGRLAREAEATAVEQTS